MVSRSSFCLNIVFDTISSNSEHRASRSSPLELHFPIPCLPMTNGHLSLSYCIIVVQFNVFWILMLKMSTTFRSVTTDLVHVLVSHVLPQISAG